MGRQFCDIPFWPCLSQEHQIQTPNIFVQNNLTRGGCLHAISLHHPSVLFLLPTHFVLITQLLKARCHTLGRWEARIKIMLLLVTSPCKLLLLLVVSRFSLVQLCAKMIQEPRPFLLSPGILGDTFCIWQRKEEREENNKSCSCLWEPEKK